MKKIENSMIRKMLDEKRLLIKYVRDTSGMRYATVVAFKVDKEFVIGASVMNKEDFTVVKHRGLPLNALSTRDRNVIKKYFLNVLNTNVNTLEVIRKEPVKFDRETGILQAMENATDTDGWFTYDEKVLDAIKAMGHRAGVWFAD